MSTRTILALATAATAAALIHSTHPAHACGGCFAPPETVTSVDSHRMVIALGLEKTVLWDQIRYTGAPQDFVWVLPVPSAETQIAVADGGFFDDLEQQTAPVLSPPAITPPSCPPPPDDWGGGVGFQDAAVASPDSGVDVYREEVVGPYQTVVIGSDSASALYDWLIAHDYNVPPATLGVISHYTNLGSKFVVLRLAPEQGVNAMQPVRVEYPGYMATFPLKMVTVGAYGSLEMTLWVIGEQRYEASNYGTVEVPRDQLVWDFSTNRSNYDQLFRSSIDNAGGRAWVTESAMHFNNVWFQDATEAELIRAMLPYPFLTRLRTDQLLEHLTDDLELALAPDSSPLSRWVQITQGINTPPPPACPDYDGDGYPDTWNTPPVSRGGLCNAGASLSGFAVVLLVVLLGLGMGPWRRRRRSPPA